VIEAYLTEERAARIMSKAEGVRIKGASAGMSEEGSCATSIDCRIMMQELGSAGNLPVSPTPRNDELMSNDM
jgi:hypothetical protein